jgi:peroxidase
VTSQLFRAKGKAFGLDLIALNIQRGRDHGLPTYVDMLDACGIGKPTTFDDVVPLMGRVVS